MINVTCAAAAMMWYHVVHILLYAEPELQDPSKSAEAGLSCHLVPTPGT
jgi:hypothetical protein